MQISGRERSALIVTRKDFFGLKDLCAEEIMYILNTAETMKYILNQNNKKSPLLQGKSVVCLFYEVSDRTKIAYEMAANNLSANFMDITLSDAPHNKDGFQDMGQLVDQMGADFIILRHPMAGAAQKLSKKVRASVINAGDGFNENPGQSLLDLMTIKEQKGGFEGLKVAIIGDIIHSRVGRSNIWGLSKLGVEVNVCGPPTLIPPNMEDFGVKVFYRPEEAVDGVDVILAGRLSARDIETNALPSLDEYKNFFLIDKKLLSYAKPDVIVMHPGPIQLGREIST